MHLAIALLGLCVWLAAEQERFIANQALGESGYFFMPNAPLKQLHLCLLLALWLMVKIELPLPIQSWLALACGTIGLARLKSWHFLPLWKSPLIIAYYAALLLQAVYFLYLGWQWQIFQQNPPLAMPLLLAVLGYWALISVGFWWHWFKH